MRVALSGLATLKEIDEKWTINDLADANEALDIKEETEAHYARSMKPKK